MDFLSAHAAQSPDRIAVALEGGAALTYAQLEEKANRLANALIELGFEQHERVTTVGYNSIEHSIVGSATRKCVLVGLPMNSRLTEEEVLYQLAHSESKAVFCGPHHVARIEAIVPQCPTLELKVAWGVDEVPEGWHRLTDLIDSGAPTPPAIEAGVTGPTMTYTAGTTGNPKGAYRKEGTDPSIVQNYMQWFDLRPADVHLVAGPLYHSAPGAFAAFNTIFGGTNIVLPKFDAETALRCIERYQVNTTFMAPILLQRIVRLPDEVKDRYDTGSLRSIIVAGAPCPFDTKKKVLEMFGEVLYEFYGSSEVGCNTVMRPDEHLEHPNSCGRPVDGIEIRIRDDDGNDLPVGETGELYIKSGQVITEYWKNEDATSAARDGDFFSVGDVGYVDEDGFLYIVDRKRDMVISGGVNICTSEIENVLHGHPDVWDVVVLGIPDEEWGESVHAIVEAAEGRDPDTTEIAGWLSERIADYKLPRSWEVRDSLPRDDAGKIRKRELREPFWEGHGKLV